MKAALSVVHGTNYVIRREVSDRSKRIDALGVDRSRFDRMPMPRWSAEAEARELPLQAMRSQLTEAERMQARRALFQMTETRT